MKYLFLLFVVLLMACGREKENPELNAAALLVGTYTKKEGHVDGKGSGLLVLDSANQTLYVEQELINPTYLATSADGKYIYTVNETGPEAGEAGSVSSFELLDNGELLHLTTQSSMSFYPCHIALTPDGRQAVVSNYAGGVAVYPIDDTHQLGEATQTLYFEGGSAHPRQDASHPHSALVSPNGRFVYVADLGANKILMFEWSGDTLAPLATPWVELEAEAGPRHMVLHPNQQWLYVINELNSTITQMNVQENGILQPLTSVSTLPNNFEGDNWTADIHISEDARFLYGSNRGHNSIAMFEIGDDGQLQSIGHESVRGEFPRNFLVRENTLWVANQNTDNVVIFEIQDDGLLSFIEEFYVATPVCLKEALLN